MILSMGIPRRFIFGLTNRAGRFDERKFNVESSARARLERVGRCVIEHYNIALEEGMGEGLETKLGFVDPELHGFACEGTAMGLFVLDEVVPFCRGNFSAFLEGHGKNHRYMSYIGAGLGVGVFHLSYRKILARERHFSKVLLMDGLGFFNGFFRTEPTVRHQQIPKDILSDETLRERFDSGLGRALWFVEGGDPEKLAATVAAFAPERHPELWAGIGLAATYACGVTSDSIRTLLRVAQNHRLMLAQGALLACHARHRAGNPAPHNDLASRILADLSAAQLHEIGEQRLKQIDEWSSETNGRTTWSVWIDMIRTDLASHLGRTATSGAELEQRMAV